ncbi:GspH/FimT family pseudopilin [Marinospirillum sp.]|uniref:GspH/FimT family pseudopilin n=1 Tax=Marinospirillum sp. TaxID=2183934 RepID=UPI003A85F8FA
MSKMRRLPLVQYQAGVGLIEILVVLLILGITFGVAVPVYQRQVEQLRVKSVAQEVLLSLRLARSEAVRTRQRVSLCALGQGVCAPTATWQQGWRMELATPAHPRRRDWSLAPDVSIEAGAGRVVFNAQGALETDSSQALRVVGPQAARCIAISPMGHSRLVACQQGGAG